MEINQVLTNIGKSIDLKVLEEHAETFKSFISETPITNERMNRLMAIRMRIEQQCGEGALALLGLMEHETESSLIRNLAFFASELIEVEGDPLGGPRLVIEFMQTKKPFLGWKGSVVGGMAQLGDKRVNKFLLEAWAELENEEMRRAAEPEQGKGFVIEGVIDFYISCLEQGCEENVFGGIVATILRMPAEAPMPVSGDFERIFPTYSANGMPIIPISSYPKSQLLEKFRERLEKLAEEETEPKLIPMIFQFWR